MLVIQGHLKRNDDGNRESNRHISLHICYKARSSSPFPVVRWLRCVLPNRTSVYISNTDIEDLVKCDHIKVRRQQDGRETVLCWSTSADTNIPSQKWIVSYTDKNVSNSMNYKTRKCLHQSFSLSNFALIWPSRWLQGDKNQLSIYLSNYWLWIDSLPRSHCRRRHR